MGVDVTAIIPDIQRDGGNNNRDYLIMLLEKDSGWIYSTGGWLDSPGPY